MEADDHDEKSIDLLVERLAVADLAEPERDLVLSAAISSEALDRYLGGQCLPASSEGRGTPRVSAPAVYLSSITVEGLRGVGERTELGLTPCPGLTIVAGRNGTGKSSFSEAAELVLTGKCSRWSDRKKSWEEGWANLHHSGDRSAEVRLAIEGESGLATAVRRWRANAVLSDSESYAQRPGSKRESISNLGLDSALVTWRPFLPYSELGGLLDDGPSRLYDAVSRILGLDDWVLAEERLKERQKNLETEAREATEETTRIRAQLESLQDERAVAVLEEIKRRTPDLKRIGEIAGGGVVPPETGTLEALAQISPGDMEVVTASVVELRDAIQKDQEHAGSEAGRAKELAQLLERALKRHAHDDGTTCPVCGTADVLDEAWETTTRERVADLKAKASAAEKASATLTKAIADARGLAVGPPAVVRKGFPDIDSQELLDLWETWTEVPEAPGDLASHLESTFLELSQAAEKVRNAANSELARRRDTWQPVASRVLAWLPQAKDTQSNASVIKRLKRSASWLATETTNVRNERFAPIAEQVRATWGALRQNSSVSLDEVVLEGSRTRRRVGLKITVDDVKGQAIAVMSQGELHALALSLFLPRATLSESPFRFIMIDDPVQAMDAERVDGLARILAKVAETHQVVVLTHDERLREATRRQGLPAKVLEVSRGKRSTITIRLLHHPVSDRIEDARAIVMTDGYPIEARRRVVPGLCRAALEAACSETGMRRLLASGMSHAEVQEVLGIATTPLELLACALWGDPGRAGDSLGAANRNWGRWAADCIQALKAGSHELVDKDPMGLISQVEKVCTAILELP